MKPERARILWEGFWTGLIGYVTVALTVGLLDLARGRSFFHTVALLGGALFGEPAGASGATVTPDLVFSYNGVHLLAFLAIGLLIAFLVREVELHPVAWYLAFFALLGMFFLGVFVVGALGERSGAGVPWWSILAANLLAAFAMGTFLRRGHPRLWREVREGADPEADDGTAG